MDLHFLEKSLITYSTAWPILASRHTNTVLPVLAQNITLCFPLQQQRLTITSLYYTNRQQVDLGDMAFMAGKYKMLPDNHRSFAIILLSITKYNSMCKYVSSTIFSLACCKRRWLQRQVTKSMVVSGVTLPFLESCHRLWSDNVGW